MDNHLFVRNFKSHQIIKQYALTGIPNYLSISPYSNYITVALSNKKNYILDLDN